MLDTVLMDEVNTTDAPSLFAAPAPASLEAFLAQIGPHAFRFAEASLRQREDALDAVQDAMLKMLTYRRHPPADWTSLFWRILRNTIVDVRRRHLVRLRWLLPQADGDSGNPDWQAHPHESGTPERDHDGRQAYARTLQALRALPARQREAFVLRIFEELDVPQTAAIMGCSEGSVKTHLSRARAALQKQLEDWR